MDAKQADAIRPACPEPDTAALVTVIPVVVLQETCHQDARSQQPAGESAAQSVVPQSVGVKWADEVAADAPLQNSAPFSIVDAPTADPPR